MPQIGAHVSAALSLELSLERAGNIGASCTQIFISPPQQWLQTKHSDKEIENYRKLKQETDIGPNFIHGTYLINLATDNPEHLTKSVDWLKYGMKMAEALGIKGLIFHPGSHKGRGFDSVVEQMVNAIKEVLNKTSGSFLILENCAGSGGVVGNFKELGELLRRVNNPQLKVCLDTQHAFAQGYDLAKTEGIERMVKEIKQEIIWKNLVVVHCNDSKVELSSNRDRHENIGEGFIGRDGFSIMLNHPDFKDLPFILEVPGLDGNGPDAENIEILNSLLS